MTKKNKELKVSLDNQTAVATWYNEYYKQSQLEIQINNDEIKRLKYFNSNQNDIIEALNKKLHKYLAVKSNVKYCEYYYSLLSHLKELYECPLSLDQLDNPTILPSGFTIEEDYFDKLMNCKDPYNKNLIVKYKIFNRFAKDVKEIINNSEDLVVKEELKIQEEINEVEAQRKLMTKDIQTDFLLRSEDDIHKIEELS